MRRGRYRLGEVSHHTFVDGVLGSGSVVLDLGAAGGDFALALNGRHGCLCHAVEPSRLGFAAIPERAGIVRHHLAAGGADGDLELRIADEEYAWGSAEVLPGIRYARMETVAALSLDTLMARLGLERVDLLKVDIEGAELPMFEAASDEAIRRCLQITVEFHDFMVPDSLPRVEAIKARLRRLGYSCIVFSRTHNGDVLFVDRRRLGISRLAWAWVASGEKYGRGLGRVLGRFARRYARSTPRRI